MSPRTAPHRARPPASRRSASRSTWTAPGEATISHRRRVLRPHADRAGQALADRPRRRAPPATCTSTATTASRTPPSCSARRSRRRSATSAGIRRFGDATVPLDEALAQCVVDVAGRPYVVHTGEPEAGSTPLIGGSGVPYAGSMTRHVVESLALNAGICVHLRVLRRPRPAPHRRGPVQGAGPCAARRGGPGPADRRARSRPRRARCEPAPPPRVVVVLDYGSGNLHSADPGARRRRCGRHPDRGRGACAGRRRPGGARGRRLRGLHGRPRGGGRPPDHPRAAGGGPARCSASASATR